MLVSLNWLREYVDLPGDLDVEALAERLTMASAEVEGIHRTGDWDRALVTVGAVLAVEPHPDADRLRLVTVDYGGEQPQRVVCGAPNVAQGQRIAFARAGATLIDPRDGQASKLKRSKIRGVESSGMVLSEAELGLSESHEGTIELPADAPVGTPLADYLGDVVLDVHTWPNRADTMCMTGIARELAAITGHALTLPDEAYEAAGPPVADAVEVVIEQPELCARYIATVVEGITIGPSPQWMQERLRAAGMRPINNVVDITNFVMLELGQPLHAFDHATVRGPVGVRLARPDERLRTLDDEDRALSPETLLITDVSGPIALAGVMGGAATEVTAATTAVLLEAARFDPVSIRRTSTSLRLRSEASARFERGLSPELALHASRRATGLLVELCGGVARAGAVDAYPQPFQPAAVVLTRQRLDTLIGFHVPDDEVERGLSALGFTVQRGGGGNGSGQAERFTVESPWWRTDVTIPDDVVEEVVRIAGYDRLPATTPAGQVPEHEAVPLLDLRERLRDACVAAGLREVMTYSLTTEQVLTRVLPPEQLADPPPLRLRNTLSSEQEVLRPTLRHSLLETVDRNLRAGAEEIAFFEIAHVYRPRRPNSGGDESAGLLPDERELACGVLTGRELDRWGLPADRTLDFFDARGAVEAVAAALGIRFEFETAEEYGLRAGRTACILAGGEPCGVVGELAPETLRAFDIEQPALLFELDLAALLPHLPGQRQARPVPRFPAVEQDLAVVVDDAVAAGAVLAIIERSGLVASARPFDVYRGDQLPAGKKSVAFAIRYQVPNRTLTTEDANREQAKILSRLEREFGAELRA